MSDEEEKGSEFELVDKSYIPARVVRENGEQVQFSFGVNLDPYNIPPLITAGIDIEDIRRRMIWQVRQVVEFPPPGGTIYFKFGWDLIRSDTGEPVALGNYAPYLCVSAPGYVDARVGFCSGVPVGPKDPNPPPPPPPEKPKPEKPKETTEPEDPIPPPPPRPEPEVQTSPDPIPPDPEEDPKPKQDKKPPTPPPKDPENPTVGNIGYMGKKAKGSEGCRI